MALIKCPECGKEVSDKAPACIHCGYPMHLKEQEEAEQRPKESSGRSILDRKKLVLKQVNSVTVDIACGFCGEKMKFGKRVFQEINETSVIPKVTLSCTRCTTQAPAGEPITHGELPKSYSITSTSSVRCPKCGSENIQLMKKGFSAGKAVAGGLLLGPVGLLGGTLGSNNVMRVCAKCGNKF